MPKRTSIASTIAHKSVGDATTRGTKGGSRSTTLAVAMVGSLICTGCAKIRTATQIAEYPRPGAVEARVFGPGEVLHEQRLRGRWLQLGDELVVEMWYDRSCRQLVHMPVVRERRVVRSGGMSLVAEWAIAGGLGLFSTMIFIKPGSLAGRVYDPYTGRETVDMSAAYRIGGLFAALAGGMLFGSIYDTVRARDEVHFTDAYRLKVEGDIPCRERQAPVAEQSVYLVVGDYREPGRTDERGRVRLRLPTYAVVPAGVHPAAVVVDERRALEVSYRFPYDQPADGTGAGQAAHTGESREPSSPEGPGITTHEGRDLGTWESEQRVPEPSEGAAPSDGAQGPEKSSQRPPS